MEILVLGGTQFVSQHFVKRLVETGHKVTTLNRATHKGMHGNSIKELYADRHSKIELKRV